MSPRKHSVEERAVLSWDEIVERYEDQWVLLEVTQRENWWPSEGKVLAHGKTRASISNAVIKVEVSKVPGADYAVCEAIRYLTTGEQVRAALKELEQLGVERTLPYLLPKERRTVQ